MVEVDQPIDVTAEERETLLGLVERHLPDTEVWVYGSRVQWTSRPQSDLDMVVFAKPGQEVAVSALREAFDESDLPFRVDLFVWDEVSDSFQKQIEREHLVLLSADYSANKFPIFSLKEVVKLTLSSVDKKTKDGEISILLCNYMDVYSRRFIRSDVPFMRATATKREIDRCRLESEDVVITKDSEKHDDIGVPALIRDNIEGLVCGYHLAILRPLREKLGGPFLYYALQTTEARHQFHSFANGVTRFGLRKDDILRVEIPLPPLREQCAIARILGTLDDKIQLNRRMNQTLESMARSIFKDWFVDFGPVRAKMEGRDAGLPLEIADLFPDRLVDSELGKIPEGWDVKTLGDVCKKSQYGYTASAQSEPVGPRFLRITDINKESWVSWSSVPYCQLTENEFKKYRLIKGDLLIARMADPGHGILVEEDVNAVFASYLIRFRPREDFNARILQYWLRSDAYWNLVNGQGSGTTRVSLNARVLGQFPLVLPPENITSVFGDVVGVFRDRVVQCAAEMQMLTGLRDALLPRLVSGQIRIPDAESLVGAFE